MSWPPARRACAQCRNVFDSEEYNTNQWRKGVGVSKCSWCCQGGGAPRGGRPATARENDASRATMDRSFVFAQGAFRNVHKGTYTVGRRAGQPCVCKIFKTGSVFEDSYFECDMKVVGKTLHLVEQWNNLRFVDKLIQVNKAEVWTFESNGERNLVEPFIYNWQKFNSNTGWTDDDLPWGKVMQALSHYSYHVSSGQFVLCDLQGGLNSNGAILTDPVIMSRAQGGYGPTDLGPDGIRNFFYRHRCNEYCRQGWTKPRNAAPIFAPRQGTSMMNSHQARHVPTMPFMQALTEHGDYYDSDSSS